MSRSPWLLVVLVLVSLGLRLRGIDGLLPHAPEPDGYLVHQSQEPATRGRYPFLWVSLVAPLTADREPPAPDASLEEHLAHASRPYLVWRLVVALVGLTLVPMTWWIARRLLRPRAAALATALVALSPVLTLHTTQARPHGLVAGTSLVAVALAMGLAARPGPGRALAACLGAAVATATLHTGALVLPALGLALVVALREPARRWATAAGGGLGLALGAALVVWSYLPPEEAPVPQVERAAALRREAAAAERQGGGRRRSDGATDGRQEPAPRTAIAENESPADTTNGTRTVELSGHVLFLGLVDGGGLAVLVELLGALDPLILVLAPFGALVLLVGHVRGRRAPSSEALVLLAHAATGLAVLGAYAGCRQRFFLLLVPALGMAAAAGLERLLPARRLPALALAALLLAPALATSLRIGELRTRPDTHELAARWIEENLPPGAGPILVLDGGEIPLRHNRPRGRKVGEEAPVSWRNYQKRSWPVGGPGPSCYRVQYPRRAEIEGVVAVSRPRERVLELLEDERATHVLYSPEGVLLEREGVTRLGRPAGRALAERGSQDVARFSPWKDPADGSRSPEHHLGPRALLDLWRVDRLGPVLELHALEP